MVRVGCGEAAAEDMIHVVEGYDACIVQKQKAKCRFRVFTKVAFALRKMLDAYCLTNFSHQSVAEIF